MGSQYTGDVWCRTPGLSCVLQHVRHTRAIKVPSKSATHHEHGNGHKALTHKVFLDQLNDIAVMLGLESLKGYGL